MANILQVFLIASLLSFLFIIIYFLMKKKLNIKYSLVWIFADISMLIVAIFPRTIEMFGKLIGVVAPVNTVFLFAGMFMILIIFTLTIIVSHMNNRIYRITQMQAILEKRLRELEDAKVK